jgi:hypothetical protein
MALLIAYLCSANWLYRPVRCNSGQIEDELRMICEGPLYVLVGERFSML